MRTTRYSSHRNFSDRELENSLRPIAHHPLSNSRKDHLSRTGTVFNCEFFLIQELDDSVYRTNLSVLLKPYDRRSSKGGQSVKSSLRGAVPDPKSYAMLPAWGLFEGIEYGGGV